MTALRITHWHCVWQYGWIRLIFSLTKEALMSEGKTYEMMWDCEYCGAAKLLGKSHRHCPLCGAAQNADKRYFPPEEEKVAVEDHQFVGADWGCPSRSRMRIICSLMRPTFLHRPMLD